MPVGLIKEIRQIVVFEKTIFMSSVLSCRRLFLLGFRIKDFAWKVAFEHDIESLLRRE